MLCAGWDAVLWVEYCVVDGWWCCGWVDVKWMGDCVVDGMMCSHGGGASHHQEGWGVNSVMEWCTPLCPGGVESVQLLLTASYLCRRNSVWGALCSEGRCP